MLVPGRFKATGTTTATINQPWKILVDNVSEILAVCVLILFLQNPSRLTALIKAAFYLLHVL